MSKIASFIRLHGFAIGLVVVGCLALALRLVNLEWWPRWYVDEMTFGTTGRNLLHGVAGWKYIDPSFSDNVLFLPIPGIMSWLFGVSVFSLRLPGAIVGSGSCVLLYVIVGKLYNRPIAFMSSLFFAIATVRIDRLGTPHTFAAFFLLLTVYFYLRLREESRRRWAYLAGVSAGIAFLFHIVGIIAIIFIVVQSLIDRRFSKVWPAIPVFVLLACGYLIYGAIFSWKYFISDYVSYATWHHPAAVPSLLHFFLLGHPESTLMETDKLSFNIWSTAGFISCFYLVGRRENADRLPLTLLSCVILVFFILSPTWYAHLVFLYVVYCLAVAIVIHDIVTGKGNYAYLGILFLVLLIPLFASEHLRPILSVGFGKWLFCIIFVVALASMFGVGYNSFKKAKSFSRFVSEIPSMAKQVFTVFMVVVLALVIITNSLYELRNMNSKAETWDQEATVEFINANTTSQDMVAVPESLTYLIHADVVPYFHAAFYITHVDGGTPLLTMKDLSRYKKDLSLSNFKYFVVDTPFSWLAGGKYASAMAPLLSSWFLVETIGDYKIYQNPETAPITEVTEISEAESLTDWSAEWGAGEFSLVTTDKKEGEASILASLTSNTEGRVGIQYNPKGQWDLSSKNYFTLYVKYSDIGWAEYYLGMRDVESRYRFWRIDYASASQWQRITLAIDDFTAEDAGFNSSAVDYFVIGANDPNRVHSPLSIGVDDIQAKKIQIPKP